MELVFTSFLFLKYSQSIKNFETLGILGRQENYLNDTNNKYLTSDNKNKKYADEFLIEQFNLKKLVTFDAFEKENPTKNRKF